MNAKTFRWKDTTVTVRARSGFEVELHYSLVYDVASAVLSANGYDIKGEYPRTLDRLITKFVLWYEVSTVVGDELPDIKLVLASKETIIESYEQWRDAVLNDGTLWELWQSAYDEVNKEVPLVDGASGETA
jgi:hypothetical protein